jgi:hypothetical protein
MAAKPTGLASHAQVDSTYGIAMPGVTLNPGFLNHAKGSLEKNYYYTALGGDARRRSVAIGVRSSSLIMFKKLRLNTFRVDKCFQNHILTFCYVPIYRTYCPRLRDEY